MHRCDPTVVVSQTFELHRSISAVRPNHTPFATGVSRLSSSPRGRKSASQTVPYGRRVRRDVEASTDRKRSVTRLRRSLAKVGVPDANVEFRAVRQILHLTRRGNSVWHDDIVVSSSPFGGDITPPALVSAAPTDEEVNVSTTSDIVLTFNENVQLGAGDTGPSLATLVTPIDVTLPTNANNQAKVQVRIMTTNAAGNDEWVGIWWHPTCGRRAHWSRRRSRHCD
jgi:Bacterial Ig-like domain